eukprot:13517857-Alexandrium_andersonii.AAC.1
MAGLGAQALVPAIHPRHPARLRAAQATVCCHQAQIPTSATTDLDAQPAAAPSDSHTKRAD